MEGMVARSRLISLLFCTLWWSCNPSPQPSTRTPLQRPVRPTSPLAKSPVSAADAGSPPPFVPLELGTLSWNEQAQLLCDRTTLGLAFAERGYTPPRGAHVIAARVLPGPDQSAYLYYSLGDTGFAYSVDRYWPASTIKLLAALAALNTMSEYGLSGDATVSFTDAHGRYGGRIDTLYRNAIIRSNNLAYDRLMLIAGIDALNDRFLTAANGFPRTVLQRAYTPSVNNHSLRRSPTIRYRQGDKEGEILARQSHQHYRDCPDEGNCITLFELLEGLRRVVLHDEIPQADRFALDRRDVKRLKEVLLEAPNKLEPGVAKALGHPVLVYNKAGRVPGADFNDHALIVDTVTRDRFLIALSIADRPVNDKATHIKLMRLARRTIEVLAQLPTDRVALRRNGGLDITLDVHPVTPIGDHYTVKATTADNEWPIRLFRNQQLIGTGVTDTQRLIFPIPQKKSDLLVAQIEREGVIVGYRALTVKSR